MKTLLLVAAGLVASMSAPMSAHADPGKLELRKLVSFDEGKVYVHTEARYALLNLARLWKENHAWTKIRIEGNAYVDDEETAIAFGQRRADAVKTWLVRFGVDPKYIESVGNSRDAVGHGSENFVDVFVDACGPAGSDCRK